MPGIPAPGTADAHAFWMSFWAALYSGILYSIVTGLVVGGMLLWVQRVSDNRRFRRDCEREVATFRERLRVAIDQPNLLLISADAAGTAPLANNVSNYLADQPIALWRETLPKERKLINSIKEFQQAHSSFILIANKLNVRLRQVVRQYNAARNAIAANDPCYQSFIIGRIFGLTAEQVLPLVDRSAEALPHLEEAHRAISSDETIQELSQPYREARDRLMFALEAVQGAVG